MNTRQQSILRQLIASTNPIDIAYFQNLYCKSERTIRSDIQLLRERLANAGINIQVSNKRGYYIPMMQKQNATNELLLLEDNQAHDMDGEEERINQIYLLLLFQKDPMSSDDIADRLYLSRSTVVRLIQLMNELAPANKTDSLFASIAVTSFIGQGYQLTGDELAIRMHAARMIKRKFRGSFTSEDWYMLLPSILKEQLTLTDVSLVDKKIKNQNAIYDTWISNSAYLTLLSYLLVRNIRMRNGFVIADCQKTLRYDNNEAIYSSDLLFAIDGQVSHQAEQHALTILLNKHGIFLRNQLKNNPSLSEALEAMLQVLAKLSSKSFDNVTLYNDLYQHLQSYFRRMEEISDVKEESNSVLLQVRNDYPEFHQLAIAMAKEFAAVTNITLSETETTYITIYLYKNLLHKEEGFKRILVVCATGKGLSNLLATRIKHVFPNLIVMDTVSVYQIENFDFSYPIDFVVSTIPIKAKNHPVIKISPILSIQDIQRMQDFLHYGTLIDKIPFHNMEQASFGNKDRDPFQIIEATDADSRNCIQNASGLVSKLILTLLEYVSKFPAEYCMDQDRMLGLMIHLVMAIPRWFEEQSVVDEDIEQLYEKMRQRHSKIFEILERYFAVIEECLLVSISTSERYSFYLYIIQEE